MTVIIVSGLMKEVKGTQLRPIIWIMTRRAVFDVSMTKENVYKKPKIRGAVMAV